MTRPLTDYRISVRRRTARWDAGDVTIADAMDFWASRYSAPPPTGPRSVTPSTAHTDRSNH